MYIIAIAWIYVVFMMSITEVSGIAGVMTFLLYGMLPVGIIVYVMGTGQRKRRRHAKERQQVEDLQARQKREDAALAATGDDR
jgi:uncharacterized membrane protein